MSGFLSNILDYVFVPKCAVCGKRMDFSGNGICGDCMRSYENEKHEYCEFCDMEAAICRCMPPSLMIAGCVSYRKAVFYNPSKPINVVRGMLYSIKRNHSRALMRFMAEELASLFERENDKDLVVTFAPRIKKSSDKYGYDQGAMIARYYSKITGCTFRNTLKRKNHFRAKEQKMLTARQRAANVKGEFSVRRRADVTGRKVLLLDDVVTSGATMAECTAALYGAGAVSVSCASIAYTYKKNKSKSD